MIATPNGSREFYLYDPDSNTFAGVGFHVGAPDDYHDDSSKVVNLHDDDTPIAAFWRPLTCRAPSKGSRKIGDFPSVANRRRIPMMSERAWLALESTIGDACEALPIHHPFQGNYYLIHVLRTVSALDETTSVVERRSAKDTRICEIHRYAFHQQMIRDLHIFKLPNQQGGELIVDDVFRNVVETHKLQGLRFRKLPLVSDREL